MEVGSESVIYLRLLALIQLTELLPHTASLQIFTGCKITCMYSASNLRNTFWGFCLLFLISL